MSHLIRVLLFLGISLFTNVSMRASITISETHVNVSCFGGSNGSIDITPSGGVGSYTYLWNGFFNTEDRTALASGTYSVTVTDSVGTSASLSINITQPTAITTSKSITDIYCGGDSTGAVDLSVSGGTGGYTYNWANGETTQDIDSIPAANYYFTVTDANGCTKFDSANVIQPPGMVINQSVTNSSCNGSNGAINLTVQFGIPSYTFLWNDGITTEDRTAIPDGVYNVTVTDASGCDKTASVTVNQTSGSMFINTSTTPTSCFGGSNGTITLTSVLGSTGPYTFEWSDGPETTQNRTGLAAGNYTVTATSSLGCSASTTINVTQPTAVNITYNSFPVTCFGANTGAITTSVTGGQGPYTRLWSDGFSSSNRFSLAAGVYRITATDSRGCTDTASILVTQPNAIIVNTSNTPVTCAGGATASVFTSVTGGTGPYSYFWTGAFNTPDRISVIAGNYNVTVTDVNGCSATAMETVDPYIPVSVSVTQITNNSCYSGNAGAINITPANGTTPYSYLWSNGDTLQDADSLALGSYTVTVTDDHSCTASVSAIVTQPNPNITINSVVTDLTCYGSADGSIVLNATNGNAPYTYLWSSSDTTSSRSGLMAGSYAVTVTDNTLCTVSTVLTVSEPTPLTLSLSPTDAACFGDSSGSIVLTATGSFSPYNFSWNEGGNTQNRDSLPAGNYSVTVVDNHSCTAVASTTINQPAEVIVSGAKSDATCFGGTDGWINVSVTGGQAPYTYNWGNSVTTPNNPGLGYGLYTVTVRDAAGCEKLYSDSIKQPLAIDVTSAVTNASCNGGANGTITLSISGGNSPYSYSWTDADTASSKTGLSSGSYSVTVTDNFNCTASHTASVFDAGTFVISSTVVNVRCNAESNGAVTLSVTGGNPPYTYDWGNNITTPNRTGLSAGSYTVTVADASGCVLPHTVAVTQPAPIVITSGITNATCPGGNDGAIFISVIGGTQPYTFDWGNATTQNRVGITDGNYSVEVSDSSFCTAVQSFVVTSLSTLAVSATVVSPTCNGSTDGSITLSVSGGQIPYRFVWNNNDTIQNRVNLAAGTYMVTITDSIGCSQVSTFFFNQPPVMNVTTAVTNISCFGETDGSISISTSGGVAPYTILWYDSSTAPVKSGLPQGNYSVNVTDSRSCVVTVNSTVVEPAALNLNLIVTNATCFGLANGSIMTTATGGAGPYAYVWSDSSTSNNRTGLAAANYSVTASDINTCTVAAALSISQPAPVSTSVTVRNNSCAGLSDGDVDLTVTGNSGPYTFDWSNDSTTEDLNNVPAGNYSVVITDANNCTYNQSAAITEPVPVTVDLSVNHITCFGAQDGSIALTITGGSPPVSVLWNNNDTSLTLSGLSAGSYSATLVDSNSCSVIVSTTIQEPAQIVISATSTSEACVNSLDGAINITVSGGTPPYSFDWDNGDNTEDIQALAAGNYEVIVTDQRACVDSISEVVTQVSPMVVTSTVQNTPCVEVQNGSVDLNVTGGSPSYIFNWSNGDVSEDINSLSQGSYDLTITDARGCTFQSGFTVTAAYSLEIDASPSVTIESGESVQIAGTTNIDNGNIYTWTPTTTLACATCSSTTAAPATTTTYSVYVMDANGCYASDSLTISLTYDNNLFIPNVFTPNQDGNNDVLQLFGDLNAITFLEFKVFNRWGEKVFESGNANFTWDGSFKGGEAPSGVYIYSMRVGFINGETRSDSKGSVTLLR